MSLRERIKVILKENHLKQKDLAKAIGVTESYISALLNGRNTAISQALATLIEEKYGYNSLWLLNGTEPKLKTTAKNRTLSDVQQRAILQVERLTPQQAKAVLAFINSLEEIDSALHD